MCSTPIVEKDTLVALVDDDAAERAATESLLRSIGYRVIGFASAEDFLRCQPSTPAACLILEVRLPGRSGLELQRHLAVSGTRVPTVLMTAQPEGRLRRQALHTGALAFLDKPFAENDLLRAVRTACSR